MKHASQNKRIAEYLSKGNKITSLQAMNKYGCMRLARVVGDLKDLGMDIKSKLITVKSGKRVSQYWVES